MGQYLPDALFAQELSALPCKRLIGRASVASGLNDRKQSRQHLLRRPTGCDAYVYNRTMRGAMSEANVRRFSGGGPPREGPMITSVSPETTFLTVPRNQPVPMLLFLDNLRNFWIQRIGALEMNNVSVQIECSRS